MSIFTQKTPPHVYVGFHPESPAGPLMIGVTENGLLCRVAFAGKKKPTAILKTWQREWPDTLFSEDPQKIRGLTHRLSSQKGLPLLMVGTPFQHKVWKALLTIPAGTTLSYGDIARKIGSPRAARAIGGAVGKNPVPLFVPCHRVIAADGSLGGFSGGLTVKRLLLSNEGACCR